MRMTLITRPQVQQDCEEELTMKPIADAPRAAPPGEIGAPLTDEELRGLGGGAIAYVRAFQSEELSRLFPQAPKIQPGLRVFALLGADGAPIMLTDSREVAIADAFERELTTVSLH
jgi:hypothetical protein